MAVIVFVGLCLVAAQVLTSSDDWENFKVSHRKSYEHKEDAMRKKIYMNNKEKMSIHNGKHKNGEVSFEVKENKFADMKEEEIKATMNGYLGSIQSTGPSHVLTGTVAPAAVDWRSYGVVTPVKDQGQCGSCWAFSATGAVESRYALKTGMQPVLLSEQNLVDCSNSQGNHGCNGGLMNNAFNYISVDGIDSESSYPYTAKDGNCSFDKTNVVANVTGHINVVKGDETSMADALCNDGPICAAIDASQWSYWYYSGGVYNESACSTTQVNHGVLVVGFGTDNGQDYWIVKNSWGPGWGEKGYIRMSKNCNNQCGIATMASYPTV